MPGRRANKSTSDESARISVFRDGSLVPLLPKAPEAAHAQLPPSGILVERHIVEPGEFPTHEHPDFCLHLQIGGLARFEWWSEGRNSIENGRPGSLILIPPGTRDRLRWTGSSQRLILSIGEEQLEKFAREMDFRTSPAFRTHWNLHDPALGHIVAEMGEQTRLGWPLGSLYFDLLSVSLSSLLVSRHSADKVHLPESKGGLGLRQLRRAMEYMSDHLADDLRLDHIARELKVSSFHFAHEFRKSTGQTPYQYLLDQRMSRAKTLLGATPFAVQAIASLVGFHSPINFVRAFRSRVGTTPGEWRKRL